MSRIQCSALSVTVLIWILASSCLPQKEITYFQSADTSARPVRVDTSGQVIIQKNDILSIYVSSVSPEASRFFNYSTEATTNNTPGNTYVVDANGDIQLPFAGNIRVAGITPLAARDSVKAKLEKYLTDPTVKLDIANFSVTVLGEVGKPGVYTVANEKMTLTEALALAGDLTIFGKRTNVMIIREVNGQKVFGQVDLTGRDFFSSPYYNLHGNDIIYVEAIGQKRATAQSFYRVMPLLLSALSLIVVLVSLTNE